MVATRQEGKDSNLLLAPGRGGERTDPRLREQLTERTPIRSHADPPAPSARVGMALTALAALLAIGAIFAEPTMLLASGAAACAVAATALMILYARQLDRCYTQLVDAARRDSLTKLLNRGGFEEAFDLELERARRTGAPLSLVVADLDRFKRINDERGHAAGDQALLSITRSVHRAKRSFDTAARIGGEEFAVLAPDCDEHGAYMLAERIRCDVERAFKGPSGALTASFGIAAFPLHGETPESLLRAADQALYAAKRLGRNRTVISSAEVPGILAGAPRAQPESQVEVASLVTLAEALDVRDSGTASHCRRVARFAELTARELGLPPAAVERLRLAGILHDVGRVGIPDDLIAREGPLEDDDWAWIRSHPETGARMLDTTNYEDVRSWVLAHHERPDDRGYPEGIPWREVPLGARIIGVADAYEAMTSERVYRPAMSAGEAAAELRNQAGRQFDEQVVEALLSAL
jgi:diguanylate cyclase (GGDEF)-like protein/putative nucleotidyltransferase with HDIG domain